MRRFYSVSFADTSVAFFSSYDHLLSFVTDIDLDYFGPMTIGIKEVEIK